MADLREKRVDLILQQLEDLPTLPAVALRVLEITGDNDLLIPASNSDYLAEHIPAARLIKVPGGSHAFNLETPDIFNGAVLEFLHDASA